MTVELTLLSGVRHRGEEIAGARLGHLLALLAADLRTGCGTARLVEELWPDAQPEHPVKALQVLVARARARLGPGVILGTPLGYRLALREDQVDACAVRLSLAASRRCAAAGDHPAALRHAEAGLALFDGVAGEDAGSGDPLAALRSAREPVRRELARVRALALARLDRRPEALEPLGALARELPRDEEVLAELLRAEAATRGTGVALARYDAYRRELREDLGSDPGPALQAVHRELLLAGVPVVRHGLRHEPNALLGRAADLAAVTGLLRTSRVVSVIGAGGLGKTRLAHAVGREAPHRVVHLVELAGLAPGGDVTAAVASALGVGEAGGAAGPAPAVDGIAAALGPGPALLILDNCEHVVGGAAGLVQALVSRTPDLRVLTTSRSPLGLSSEAVYPLPELDLSTAAELFTQRARAARPDADLSAATVRDLCGRLDGLPLAVELAAARIRVMSAGEITRRLDDRFALLRGGPRDAPPRHRTLHAVIDWSWHLLDPAGQRAMRTLSVFPGGFTAAAARRLIGDDAVIEDLAGQSLLKVTDSGTGTRLRMVETVREFSTARCAEAGETDATITAFLGWATDLGTEQHQVTGLVPGLDLIRAEQDNLGQALRYGLERADGPAVAATAALLGSLWLTDSQITRLAALARDVPPVLSHFRPGPELVEATRSAAVLCALSAFLTRQASPLRALAVLRRLPPGSTGTLIGAAQVVLGAPDAAAVLELRGSARPLVAGIADYAISHLAEGGNDLDEALRAARRMLTALGDDAEPWLRAVAHARIGELCLQAEPGQEAFRHLAAALSLMEELQAWSSASRARWAILLADLQRGAFDDAERMLATLGRGTDEPGGLLMFDVCARAEISLGRGDADEGLLLWRRAADGLRVAGDDGSWTWEVQAVAVVTHAWHDRLDLVADIVDRLPAVLAERIASATTVQLPACGSLLLALGLADLGRGATASGLRLIALATRLGWQRGFQPAMSAARVTALAERTDRPAYADAVSSYAGLDGAGLRAAVLAALAARAPLSPADRA